MPMNTSKTALDLKLFSKLLSDGSLTKKAYLNILVAALDFASRLLVGFILTPLLVTGLGNYFYGAWRVLERLVGYISPASGRASQALKWTLASQQGSSDKEQKRRYVGSALAVWMFFLPILTVFGALLAWFAPSWMNTPEESFRTVRLTAGLLVAGLVMTSLVEIPRSVLEGENLGYKRMGLSAILVFTGGALTWLALFLNTGIAGVAAAALATSLLTGLLFLQVTRTYAPWFGVSRPSFEAARHFLGLSGWFLAWNLIMRMMLGSDIVVLGFFGSVESVTTYSLTKYAPDALVTLVEIMVFGITPGLGGIIGSGNSQKACQVRNEVMSLTWLSITVSGSTVLLWNWAFIRLWVGPEHYAGSTPTLLIVMLATQFILIRNDANIIDLTLRLRHKVLIGALSVMLSLTAAVVFVNNLKWGISGLCLGLIFGRFLLSIGYPLMVSRFLKASFASQFKATLRPAFVTALLFGIASKLSELVVSNNWFMLCSWIDFALLVGGTIGAVLLVAFHAGLSENQRGNILRRVRVAIAIGSD